MCDIDISIYIIIYSMNLTRYSNIPFLIFCKFSISKLMFKNSLFKIFIFNMFFLKIKDKSAHDRIFNSYRYIDTIK